MKKYENQICISIPKEQIDDFMKFCSKTETKIHFGRRETGRGWFTNPNISGIQDHENDY